MILFHVRHGFQNALAAVTFGVARRAVEASRCRWTRRTATQAGQRFHCEAWTLNHDGQGCRASRGFLCGDVLDFGHKLL